MSYKHTNFSDSEVFRSFEKLANDKGMIVHDPLAHIEQLPAKSDLSLSDNLAENVLKLSAGLRAKGFSKYADELESRFLVYKEAKTHLYRAHNEDGEDVVNAAHPDGDVHIADAIDNHGDFHTTLSKHKKILDVIQKEPTGKLAAYVNQCKVALGQAASTGEPQNPLALFEKFTKSFSAEVKRTVIDAIGPDTKYQDIALENGKSVKDYFNNTIEAAIGIHGINSIPEILDELVKEWKHAPSDAKEIMGRADAMVKKVFELLSAIDKTIDKGMPGFDNPKYPDIAYTKLNPFQEQFQTIFTTVYGTDASWHAQWFSVDQLQSAVDSLKSSLLPVNAIINRHILQNPDPELKKEPQLVAWFQAEHQYLEKFVSLLSKLVADAEAYQSQFATPSRAKMGLINVEALKKLASPELLEDLNFTSKDNFLKALQGYAAGIMKDCLDAIKASGFTDQQFKNELIQRFGG